MTFILSVELTILGLGFLSFFSSNWGATMSLGFVFLFLAFGRSETSSGHQSGQSRGSKTTGDRDGAAKHGWFDDILILTLLVPTPFSL